MSQPLQITDADASQNRSGPIHQAQHNQGEYYVQVPTDGPALEPNPQHHGHRHHHGMSKSQEKFIVFFTIFMPINVLILEYFVEFKHFLRGALIHGFSG